MSGTPKRARLSQHRQFHNSSTKKAQTAVDPQTTGPSVNSHHLSGRLFRDANVSAESRAAIKHEFMTNVQAATLDLAQAGKDLLVQAKTGTGKTLAFLLPAIERLLNKSLQGISILVLAPTRELALQIEDEAKTLLSNHRSLTIAHAIGGTNINTSWRTILTAPPTILIATPGRLLDHLQSPLPPQYAAYPSVASLFAALKTIVYDEADRLLDQGFKRELDAILGHLPDKDKVPRQAMMFSATVSTDIRQIAATALKKDYNFVSTLLEDDVNTHEHVAQTYIVTPFVSTLPTVLHILRQELITYSAPILPTGPTPRPNLSSTSKTIVFFPTARQVSLAAAVFSSLSKNQTSTFVPTLPPVFEIHSRMSQTKRTASAEGFKNATSGILLSSDVAARGMDFPGVTLVLQVGIPSSSEQYIHRLGRTGRAGAAGRGILILAPEEKAFLGMKGSRELPITEDAQYSYAESQSSSTSPTSTTPQASAHLGVEKEQEEIFRILGTPSVSDQTKSAAYRAWLGYYNTFARNLGWSKTWLVDEAGRFAREGMRWEGSKLPEVERRTLVKMGLQEVPGLNVVKKHAARGAVTGQGDGARTSCTPRGEAV